jgi:hypothetical protein
MRTNQIYFMSTVLIVSIVGSIVRQFRAARGMIKLRQDQNIKTQLLDTCTKMMAENREC